MTSRKKPGMAFWMTVVVVVVLVEYPLSFGPACWLTSRLDFGAAFLPIVYLPVNVIWERDIHAGDTRIAQALYWYSQLYAARDWRWLGTGKNAKWKRETFLE